MDILHLRAASTIHSSSLQLSALLHYEDFSVYNHTDEDDDAQSLVCCPFCDFELDISATSRHLEDVITLDPTNMVCPLCDEKVGEYATGKFISLKSLKSEKSSVSSGDSPMLCKKLAARGDRHEAMAYQFLSPFISNASAQNPSNIHPGEDFIINASDISNSKSSATGSPDMGDEKDHEERRLRASFVQQLILSTF